MDTGRIRIVCLCGSTSFREAFEASARAATLAGQIVLSPAVFSHHDGDPLTAGERTLLDDVHRAKIELADEILVVNVDGYLGEATLAEIAFARSLGKPVRYLEPQMSRSCESTGEARLSFSPLRLADRST